MKQNTTVDISKTTFWRDSNFGGECNIYNGSKFIASDVESDTADLICKAVNNYDALVNSHKDLMENLARLIDRIKENDWSEYIPSAYDRAKESIEKATELLNQIK